MAGFGFSDPAAARQWARDRAAALSADRPRPRVSPATSLRAPAAAAVEVREPASPRVSSLRAGWRWLVRANRRIEDSWVGDLIGVVSLFGLLWIGLVAAAIFG